MVYQNLQKFRLPPNFRGKPSWYVQLWWLVQDTLFRLSPQFMYSWRRFLLRCFGAKIGKNVIIRPTVRVTFPWKIEIGDNSWIGDEVVLYSLGKIKIGTNAVVSQRSYLCTGSHDYESENFDITAESITIKDEVWLATDVFVAPGVTIGEGAVIGARSSVFKDIEGGYVYAGTPARRVKKREKASGENAEKT